MYLQNLFWVFLFVEILCPVFQNFEDGVARHATPPTAGTFGVPVNSIVYFSCIEGFRLSFDVILTCLYNGSWSESPPVCLGAHWTKSCIIYTVFLDKYFFLIADEKVRVTKINCVYLEYSLIQIKKINKLNFKIRLIEYLIQLI